jgi:hypothetical protein
MRHSKFKWFMLGLAVGTFLSWIAIRLPYWFPSL